MDQLAWYPALEGGRLTIASCVATCLKQPRDLINRRIVSRQEELALTDPDAVDEHEVGSTEPCPEAEPLDSLLPAPEAPETKVRYPSRHRKSRTTSRAGETPARAR